MAPQGQKDSKFYTVQYNLRHWIFTKIFLEEHFKNVASYDYSCDVMFK